MNFRVAPVLGIGCLVWMVWSWGQFVPGWDASQYLEVGYKTYRGFFVSPGGGLLGFYLNREWRGVLTGSLSAPFFFLSAGDPGLGAQFAAVFFFALAAVSAYLCARRFLEPWRATLAMMLVMSQPWAFGFATEYLSDFVAFALFGVSQWLFLVSDKESERLALLGAGVFAGMALCCRPFEFAVVLGLQAGVAAVSGLGAPREARAARFWNLSVYCGTAILLAGAWYAGSYERTRDWLSIHALGGGPDIRQQWVFTGSRLARFASLLSAFTNLGSISALALSGYVTFVAVRQKRVRAEIFKSPWIPVVLAALGFLVLGSWSTNFFNRFYIYPVGALLLAAWIQTFREQSRAGWVLVAAGAVVLGLQLIYPSYTSIRGKHPWGNEPSFWSSWMSWAEYPSLVSRTYDDCVRLAPVWEAARRPGHRARILFVSSAGPGGLYSVIVPWVHFNFLVKRDPLEVTTVTGLPLPDEQFSALLSNFDYVLFGPVERALSQEEGGRQFGAPLHSFLHGASRSPSQVPARFRISSEESYDLYPTQGVR
jgi:hypothetical protein